MLQNYLTFPVLIGISPNLLLLWTVFLFGFMNKSARTFFCKSLCEDLLSFLLGRCGGVEYLGPVVDVCLMLWKTAKLFKNGCTILYSHQRYIRVSFSTSSSTLDMTRCLLNFSPSSGCEWYLIMVLICFPLVINKYLSCVYWPFRIRFCEKPISVSCLFLYWVIYLFLSDLCLLFHLLICSPSSSLSFSHWLLSSLHHLHLPGFIPQTFIEYKTITATLNVLCQICTHYLIYI